MHQMYNKDMNNDTGYVDFNRQPDFNYILQYIYESEPARLVYQELLYRTALALEGKPWKNLYQEELASNIENIKDKDKQKRLRDKCLQVPEGRDFSLAKAVQSRANQMASGVDTYEYQINDPYMIINDETEDLLSFKCSQDYAENKLGNFASVFSRDLTVAGVTAVRVDYDPASDKNSVVRINPKNILWDTKYSSTGRERFRGYNTMISWQTLKKMIQDNPNEKINLDIKAPDESIIAERKEKDRDGNEKVTPYINKQAKYHNRKIRSLNGLDIYVQDMNRLATSPSLQGQANGNMFEFTHDLENCYNLNYYTSMATTDKAMTNSNYQGDDVELTVIFDMVKGIEYKVINRRYVISANGDSYHRWINYEIADRANGQVINHLAEFKLECPIKFQFEWENNRDNAPWPTSPLINLLDMHDKLCALRAKREHVAKILSILRVTTNAGDAESLAEAFNIQGVILDDIQGDISNIQFAYDWSAIDSQIDYYERTIKEYLSGYSEFDAMQMMGDRASAAESGMAVGAIAQGLSTHQNAIMQLYADIARQCIGNRVVYSSEQTFPINNNGNYSAVTLQQMSLSAVINVRPKMAKTIHERMLSANALQTLGTLGQSLPPEGQATLIELALMGVVPRKVAANWIQPQQPSADAIAAAQLEGQNMANMLSQNSQAYQENPLPYEVDNAMANSSPEEIDAIIAGLGGAGAPQGGGMEETIAEQAQLSGGGVEGLDMFMQEGAMSSGIPGQTAESGAAMANPNSMI